MAKYRCGKCGSENVEHAFWVNPNTLEVGEVFGSWNEDDASFCNDCDATGCIETENEEPS